MGFARARVKQVGTYSSGCVIPERCGTVATSRGYTRGQAGNRSPSGLRIGSPKYQHRQHEHGRRDCQALSYREGALPTTGKTDRRVKSLQRPPRRSAGKTKSPQKATAQRWSNRVWRAARTDIPPSHGWQGPNPPTRGSPVPLLWCYVRPPKRSSAARRRRRCWRRSGAPGGGPAGSAARQSRRLREVSPVLRPA
jgi:hypothetical protein